MAYAPFGLKGPSTNCAVHSWRQQLIGRLGPRVILLLGTLTALAATVPLFGGALAAPLQAHFATLHLLLEALPIAVCGLIFAIGWSVDSRDVPRVAIWLGCMFAGVGVLTASHLLSFPDTPTLLPEYNLERAYVFSISARLFAAAALTGTLLLQAKPLRSGRHRYAMLSGVLLAVAIIHLLAFVLPSLLPTVYRTTGGPTDFKLLIGSLVMLLYVVLAAAFLRRLCNERTDTQRYLFAAIWVIALSEFLFIGAQGANDLHQLAGHGFKFIAFVLIYRAVFHQAVREPYALYRTQKQQTEQSEARLRDLLELSTDWYWEQDENMRFTDISPGVQTTAGIDRNAFIGKTRWELPVLNLGAEDWQEHRNILARREPFSGLQIQQKNAAGEDVWGLISGKPVFDDSGQFRGYRGIGRDITHLKNADRGLRESEQRFRAVFEQSAVGMAMLGLDGRFLEVNPQICAQVGYEHEELLRMNVKDVTHPEDVAAIDDTYIGLAQGLYAGGTTEKRCFRKSGELMWASISRSAVRDASGEAKAIAIVVRDITDRKHAEEAKAEADRLTRVMLDALSASVCVLDIEGDIVAVNSIWEQRFQACGGSPGFSPVGTNYLELCEGATHSPDAIAMGSRLRQILAGQRSEFTIEYACQTPRGKTWHLVKTIVIPGHGRLRAVMSHEEITSIKHSQQILENEKRVLEMLANGKHATEVLARMCEQFEDMLYPARYAVWIVDVEKGHLTLAAAATAPPDYIEAMNGARIGMQSGAIGVAAQHGSAVYCTDLSISPEWETLRGPALRAGIRASWAHPITTNDGAIAGVIEACFPDERSPTSPEKELLERAAHLAGIVLERSGAEERRRLMATVFADSQEGIIITDSTNSIVLVNRAFSTITGYTAHEVIGKDPRLLSSGVHDREFYESMWRKISERGFWRGEVWDRRSSGELYCEELSISAVRNESGKTTHHVAIFSDVTERKQSEETLRANEALLRTVTNNVPASIAYYDGQLRCRFANQKHGDMFARSPDELLGRHLSEFCRPDDYAQADPYLRRALAGKTAQFEMTFHWPDDAESSMAITLVPDLADDGRVPGCYIFCHDVTAIRSAERRMRQLNTDLEQRVAERTRQLAAANTELEAFSYSVSHDLRAPLRTIEGFSRIIETKHSQQLDQTARSHLDRIGKATRRMGELIDDLLQLSRVTKAEVRTQRVDLTALADEVAAELAQRDPTRTVSFEADPGLEVRADLRLLRIVLENLLGNAWKFTARVRAAKIELRALDGEMESGFMVRDNGAGFDMRYISKLFGPFQRLHGDSEFEGTGIGLAIVRRILVLHGWEIRAESETGNGASFFVVTQPVPNGD